MKTRKKTCVRPCALTLCLSAFVTHAQAIDHAWTSSGGNKNDLFDRKQNWDPAAVPGAVASDRVFFTGASAPQGVTAVTMSDLRTLDSLNLQNGWNLTIQGTGGGLNVNSLITNIAHTGSTILSVPLTAGTVVLDGGTLVVSSLSGNTSITVNAGSVGIGGNVTTTDLTIIHATGTGFGTNGGVTVNGMLRGIGTISGPVTVNGTHQVGVGTNAVGTQTFQNTLNYGASSVFDWTLKPIDETYDKVVVTGAVKGISEFVVNIGGNSFDTAFWDEHRSWSDIVTGGAGSDFLASMFTTITGTGIGPNGVVAGQGQFSFTGNTLEWVSVVPEPSSLLAGLLLGAGAFRRSTRTTVIPRSIA